VTFANPTAGGRIQAESEQWDGQSIRVTRGCAGHQATGQGCAVDLGDGKCTRAVLAVAPGTVTYRDNVQGIIRIAHSGGWQSDYAHMNPLLVTVGQQVTQGQQIGEIGDAHDPAVTNFSGCHLHFGLLLFGVEQDPWPYLNATLGDDMPKLTLVSYPDGPHTCNIPAGGTVQGWSDTGLVTSQTFQTGSSFPADCKVQITQTPSQPPEGVFYHCTAGIFAGLYVPTPHAVDAGPALIDPANCPPPPPPVIIEAPAPPATTADVAGALAQLNLLTTDLNNISKARTLAVSHKNAARTKLGG